MKIPKNDENKWMKMRSNEEMNSQPCNRAKWTADFAVEWNKLLIHNRVKWTADFMIKRKSCWFTVEHNEHEIKLLTHIILV